MDFIKDDNPCIISSVKAEFGILSNMSPHSVSYNDIVWPRAEQLFQALRFAENDPLRVKLQQITNPVQCKIFAKTYVDHVIVKPRTAQDLENMLLVLKLKYNQHEDVRILLDKIGDRDIIENCSNRATESGLFWGAQKIEIVHSANLFGQIEFLANLAEKTSQQTEILERFKKLRAMEPGIYWRGHNWLGKLWKKVQNDNRRTN